MNAVRYPEAIRGAKTLAWSSCVGFPSFLPRTKPLLEEGTRFFQASSALNYLLRNLATFL
tara:strand:- start:3983 stop:4162 length:180 start_codon:yes stop_codon:yes gene_type:complete